MEGRSSKSIARQGSSRPGATNVRTGADRLCQGSESSKPDFQEAALRALLKEAQEGAGICDTAEIHDFVIAYFRERFRTSRRPDQRSRLQDTACLLAETILALFDAEPVPMQTLEDLKHLLGEIIRQRDPFVTEILVSHCLEKLFESRRIANLFADWQEQPALASVYAQALAWGEGFWPKTRGF